MKKQDIVELIMAHYDGNDRLFFRKSLDVLKEFKANGDGEIAAYLDSNLKSKVKIMPKQEVPTYNPEITFEEAGELGWTLVPQEYADE